MNNLILLKNISKGQQEMSKLNKKKNTVQTS